MNGKLVLRHQSWWKNPHPSHQTWWKFCASPTIPGGNSAPRPPSLVEKSTLLPPNLVKIQQIHGARMKFTDRFATPIMTAKQSPDDP
ncbi:hypothetical protein [Ligilactobacillus ruminis]|uniref:hypothetical protein n=1 Tax=Ligilactobacillus ruminis TaxID=1623 RepID=UPI002330381A|nr:hypothetical protein [Ligilactobacillus ruminis]